MSAAGNHATRVDPACHRSESYYARLVGHHAGRLMALRLEAYDRKETR